MSQFLWEFCTTCFDHSHLLPQLTLSPPPSCLSTYPLFFKIKNSLSLYSAAFIFLDMCPSIGAWLTYCIFLDLFPSTGHGWFTMNILFRNRNRITSVFFPFLPLPLPDTFPPTLLTIPSQADNLFLFDYYCYINGVSRCIQEYALKENALSLSRQLHLTPAPQLGGRMHIHLRSPFFYLVWLKL